MSDFEEELEGCAAPRSLVLGNGFGRSYDTAFDDDRFSWNTLLELCDIQEGSQLHGMLQDCNFDFELVHQKLHNATDVVDRYAPGHALSVEFQDQVQYLRDQLIVAVSNSHPDSFNREYDEDEQRTIDGRVANCRRFLTKFVTVFSLNYDLLLYWVRLYGNNYLGQDSFTMRDGKLVFVPNEQTNFFFPHGALFLSRDGISAVKSKSSRANPILATVERNIRNGIFPMCISEGTGDQKYAAIKRNAYLLFAYDKLSECEGTIFTFGCSFYDGKDDHIIKALLRSPAHKIVVGDFRPTEEAELRLRHVFARLQAEERTRKEIVVADTSSISIW
jgi:hypothetical protein